MNQSQTFSQLKREQKEAIGLLSIGTFLEYFDLMLYVHMAVLLNDLFFPKTDPHTTALISAFAFCSTFIFRPVGALIFGWIGDNIGRKVTVIITTFMMSLSCIIMANLPTYEQIGVSATYLLTICRVIQGMSSMGEITGAQLYLTEITKPPVQYSIVSLIGVFSALGGAIALAVASLTTSYGLNWRIAFWGGAGIAIIGSVARTNLRETPEFADAKRRIKNIVAKTDIDTDKLKSNPAWKEQVGIKTSIAYFLIECAGPVWFYTNYVYCGTILKNVFNCSIEQIIHQNFIVAMVYLLVAIFLTYLVYKVHPLKLLWIKLIIFSIFSIMCPILLASVTSPFELLLIQLFFLLAPITFPAVPIFFIHFPVFKRFTYSSLIFAVSRALMFIITSFGIVYLTEYYGHWGLLIIIIPILIGYMFGIHHFKKLEVEAGNYY